jgi:hypothetical protein
LCCEGSIGEGLGKNTKVLFVGFNPFVIPCHLPYIFALQKHPVILRDTAGRRVNNPLFIAEKCTYIALRHPVMPRGTAAEECEILIDGIGRELIKLYKNEREAKNLLPFRVIELGFEPKTHSLEGCCSIQLSYSTDLL